MSVRKRDVRPTDASVVKQISTALTCVAAAIEKIFARTVMVEEDEDVAYERDDSSG